MLSFVIWKYSRLHSRMHDQLDLISRQCRVSHNLVHNQRNEVYKNTAVRAFNDVVLPEDRDLLKALCQLVVDHTKRALQVYFLSNGVDIGDDMHVSMKLMLTPTEILTKFDKVSGAERRNIGSKVYWVMTFVRDADTTSSAHSREIMGYVYDIDRNTAFSHIINMQEACFSDNDLKSRENYLNEHTDWHKFYNSTIVVPVRYRDNNNPNDYVCYGLLAADSLNEREVNLYDRTGCKDILGHAADLLAILCLLLPSKKIDPQAPAIQD